MSFSKTPTFFLVSLTLAALLLPIPRGRAVFAQSADVWQAGDIGRVRPAFQLTNAVARAAYRLNPEALTETLARAPMEFTADLKRSAAILALPLPDGTVQRFRIEESPVLDAAGIAAYPQIKSYRGRGLDDETASVRFDWTPLGLHALILAADRPAVNIQPAGGKDWYVSYYDQNIRYTCGVTAEVNGKEFAPWQRPEIGIGGSLRREKLAVAATWEFCNTIGGDTVVNSVAAINAFVNASNAIYERELSLTMILVNAPNVIYAANNNVCGPMNNVACTASNDPYTNSDESVMLNQVDVDLRDKVGTANFDVGHVLGTGSSGVAQLAVVCDGGGAAPPKARGASRVFGPPGNSSASGLFAHELGHQHGASHTFNGTMNFCGGQRSPAQAWEVGSGTTLMSYAGICDSDNVQAATEPRFHNGSYGQVLTYLAANGGCATFTATGNSVPTVDAGVARTIPRLTPFTLTATGTDPDAGDVPNLRFVWEQLDAGGALYPNPPYGDQPGDPSTTTRPLFRAYAPVPGRARTFPSLTYILNNANVPPATLNGFQVAESLPGVSRTLNFRCTVRDQRGGVNESAVALTVAGGAGPFAVTFPNGGENLSGAQTITWNVAGTNLAPVSTSHVRLSLSTDGGSTFPILLAANAPNTGSATLTLPNGIATSQARIKAEAVGNIFFDISNANFTITPADTCPAVSNLSPRIGNVGTVVTLTGVNLNGVTGITFGNAAATNFTVNSATQITATVPAGATGGQVVLTKAGCASQPAGIFTVCSNPPVTLAIDDGSPESASNNGPNAYYVNRLTPTSYPATLTQVAIYFAAFQQFPAGSAINVVAGAGAAGANIDGVSFQSVPATVGTLGGYTVVNLPNPMTIMSGDFVLGFQVVGSTSGFPMAIDQSSAAANRSYTSSSGSSFTLSSAGNFMIRGPQTFSACASGAPVVQQAVSRKTHNGVPFDIPLPLSGAPGVECRSGGVAQDYQVVVTFASGVTFNSASVSLGAGNVSGSSGSGSDTLVINLTGVSNAQRLNLTLAGVSDGGSAMGNIVIPMNVLLGDVNGSASVSSSDIGLVKAESGNVVGPGNFRADLNANGSINASDVSLVKAASGTFVP